MADDSDQGDIYHGSTEDLVSEIRKMEKEKEELERKNQERQRLEQQLKQLKRNVSSLKAGNKGGGKGESQRRSDTIGVSSDLSASLEESQSCLRDLQQSLLTSPIHLARERKSGDFNESFEEVDDDVMSHEHKQALRANRDVLVENMTPDDIFNDLISKHILTSADVSRIKERNTVEAINEELLNVLVRRSDRAFHVFVSSLRRTLQGWLANRLDSNSQPRSKRKRRTGELNIDIDCEKVSPISKHSEICTCQEVERQILLMAKGAFSNIRRRDASASSFEQFKKELQQTNQVIKDSLELMNSLKFLCRHGEITDLSSGSVRFTVHCKSFRSCQRLWKEYESGELLSLLQKGIVTHSLLTLCGAKSICIRVRISRLDFLTCALELGHRMLRSYLKQPVQQVNFQRLRRGQKGANQNQIPGKTGESLSENYSSYPIYRKAFQEISSNVITGQNSSHFTRSLMNKKAAFYTSHSAQCYPQKNPVCFSANSESISRVPMTSPYSSILDKTQLSPPHKTRSFMRKRQNLDLENLSGTNLVTLRKQKPYLKLYAYNLRTRSVENTQ